MNILRWLLTTQLKSQQRQNPNGGFTLVELLVAMLLAFLVITPLMGFMLNILDSDRREQAKANTEQETQTALDYISRDLQQAIYIYDDTGVDAIKAQIPTVTDGYPILVFWKREFTKEAVQLQGLGVGVPNKDDSFVYSLVAYYLVKDNKAPWSRSARINRFKIRDGVISSSGSTCTGYTDKYSLCPNDGFKPFNLSQKGKTLEEMMNSWTKNSQPYKEAPIALVDYIDQTTITQGAPGTICPTGFKTIPSSATITGFYVCVDSVAEGNKSLAEVHLRGNALARLIINDDNKILYNQQISSYFPTGTARVQGRSFIFTK